MHHQVDKLSFRRTQTAGLDWGRQWKNRSPTVWQPMLTEH
jgi:hypothetical protein